jgi:hypothetical protein
VLDERHLVHIKSGERRDTVKEMLDEEPEPLHIALIHRFKNVTNWDLHAHHCGYTCIVAIVAEN